MTRPAACCDEDSSGAIASLQITALLWSHIPGHTGTTKTKFSASTKQNSNKQICGALSHALDKGTATAVHPRALRSLRPPAGIHQAHSVGPLVGKEEQWCPWEHTPQDTYGVPLSTLSRTPWRDGGALECFCFTSITRRC